MFEQSKLKIERANYHISDLNQKIIEYFKSCPYDLFIDKAPSTGTPALALRFHQYGRDEWSLIIGDCLHNLRSSLDVLVTDITGNEDSQFRFRKERKELENKLHEDEALGLPASAVSIILDLVRPYEAGNYTLWAMNKLNNIDKHRLIIPIVNFAEITNIGIKNRETGEVSRHAFGAGAGPQITFYTSLGSGSFELIDNGQSSFEALFQDNGYFDAENVVETLHKMSAATSKAIEAFEN